MTTVPINKELLHPQTKNALFNFDKYGLFIPQERRFTSSFGEVRYLTEPGVSIEAKTLRCVESGVAEYIRGLNPLDYEATAQEYETSSFWCGSETLVAGQLCYQSYLPGKRTRFEDLGPYIQKLLESRHGSVLEHTNVSFLIYGISRSVSHEWVRHRAGFSYSQVSQRYVDAKNVRFVLRPEQDNEKDRTQILEGYARQLKTYQDLVDSLAARKSKEVSPKDLRKQCRQAAREVLPNATETAMYVTGNLRAWRGFLDQRSNPHADSAIQEVAWRCALILLNHYPHHFADYEWWSERDSQGIPRIGVITKNTKV